MGSIQHEPQLMYPAPLEGGRDNHVDTNGHTPADLEAPILIIGGGPVGMLQALLFARLHHQPCILVEREAETTHFPKMEYTNGRSMAIYRKMGLHDDVRAMATQHVPEDSVNDELIVTSLAEGGKLLHVWKRGSATEQRKQSKLNNDGSQYLEPHMRCHQILIEAWLKKRIDSEDLVQGFWGTAFVGLEEKDDHVVSVVKKSDNSTIRIKSRYVIGCDGGGSWVRKSVGLESKRKSLDMTMAFVHFRSSSVRASLQVPRFWHANVIGGGVVVSQDEDDTFTCHYMVPPGIDAAAMNPEEVVALGLGGCQGPAPVEFDEIYCRGVWKTDVAIADAFRSAGGRVFLAGDAAHQLSPVGGHGLNSGLGDAFDLAWKLSAVLRGWAGENLLASYDNERRAIAFENLGHVQHALSDVVMPIFTSHLKYGADTLGADSLEGEEARKEVAVHCKSGEWLHNQNGNIQGYSYKCSPVVIYDTESGERPEGSDPDQDYIPTTWPGSQAPHVWMDDSRSTLDVLSPGTLNLVDFSKDCVLGKPFVDAASEIGVPMQILDWHHQQHVRRIYERDLMLIRPDMHVAWRISEGVPVPPSKSEAISILRSVLGL